ncbi:MAG: Rieske (2Fe-2S) protein [Candidatus Bathyarchaeota archaeon]|nr:Rieske (2Fe-2S) protein [Candidatus Bathyarchaeota archaeon]MDH5595851.1 Rieske (2Fe-2S) protein [Candidatus Bathyarchaeota archaeon]
MGEYVKMAEAHEIPKNKMKVFKVEDHEILVVNVEGELHAFENRCPHMGYPLYFGRLEGKVLTCGFHYAKFDVTTGKSLGSVTDKPLKKLKIKIQNSLVQVEL